jgi:hypothetical protein
MLLFRSVSVGLLGAVLYFVASASNAHEIVNEYSLMQLEASKHEAEMLRALAEPPLAEPTRSDVTIVDVAHGVDATTIASLIRLDRRESIVSVDGRAVDGNVAAGAAIAAHVRGSHRYIDVEVATRRDRRRVLVLLH